MSIETREELERPGALARALDEATAAVACAEGAAAERLGNLGAPAVLDALLRLLLARALRGGAATGVDPGAVVRTASTAARRGLVPMATVEALRGTVRGVEGGLRDLGLWRPGAEEGRAAIPPPDDLEELWDGLGGEGGPAVPALPDGEDLAAALAGGVDAPAWLAWPGAVVAPLLRRVAGELRTAAEAGVLPLTPGGVGREGRTSQRRHDAALYATGLEAGLLRRAPATALLVQHLQIGRAHV